MTNKFSYGTLAKGEFFTDRKKELAWLKQSLDSENHLILISPRRYGKSSLVKRCLEEIERPYIWLDLQYVVSLSDFASQLLKGILARYTFERIKYELSHFRIVPTTSLNLVTNEWQVSFVPSADSSVMLEDVLALIEKVSTPEEKLIVVFDEFQEVRNIDKNLDKKLRSIMQHQSGLNYVFLGSQEGMMLEIFERKKSPFYHFGQLMRLDKIPYEDFYRFVYERLPEAPNKDSITRDILTFTYCHPYYTQQLAYEVWKQMTYDKEYDEVVKSSIQTIVQIHDLDYERLWETFNRTDRSILLQLSKREKPLRNREMASSTIFSALKRMVKSGVIIRTENYELEDPFFREWLSRR